MDQFGNYTTGLQDNADYVTPQSGTPFQIGDGPPTGSTPVTIAYIDQNTGDLYTNPTLTAGQWVLVSGGSGGGMTAGHYAGIAPSFTPATAAAMAADQDTGKLWIFINAAWYDTGIQLF